MYTLNIELDNYGVGGVVVPAQLNSIEMQWKALRRRASGIWRFTMFASREVGGRGAIPASCPGLHLADHPSASSWIVMTTAQSHYGY